MTQDGNPGADASGRYHVAEWEKWALEHGKDTSTSNDPEPGTKKALELERMRYQVDALKLDLDERRATLISAEDTKRWVADIVFAFRTELLSLPGKMAPQMMGLTIAEAEQRLKSACNDVLMKLHREPWSERPKS